MVIGMPLANPDPSKDRPTILVRPPYGGLNPLKLQASNPLELEFPRKKNRISLFHHLGSMVIGMGIVCLESELPKLLKDKQHHLGQTQVKLNGIVFRCKSAKDRLFLQQQLEIRQKSY